MKLSPPFNLRKGAFTLGIVVVLTWLFLYTQADLIFGQYAAETKDVMNLYFIMFLIVAVISREGLPGGKEGLKSLLPFGAAAIITFFVAYPVRMLIPTASLEFVTIALGFGLLYSLVKAYIEELVFRYYLPKKLGLGDVVSNILFGLFHLAVAMLAGLTVVPWASVIMLMFIGYGWSLVRRWFQSSFDGKIGAGIMGATGSHFAWNVLDMMIRNGSI